MSPDFDGLGYPGDKDVIAVSITVYIDNQVKLIITDYKKKEPFRLIKLPLQQISYKDNIDLFQLDRVLQLTQCQYMW